MTVPNETDTASRPAAVYRLYDAEGVLLYIGSSYDPDVRLRTHREKWWGQGIARRTVEWHPDRATAYEQEAAAILREDPKCNQYGKVDAPDSEAILRRNELNRLRERTLSEAAGILLAAERAVESRGGSRIEAVIAGRLAKIEFLERTGIHAKRLDGLRADVERWQRLAK